MENKPIKRHTALRPLSRDHHYGLLFCWKIKEGVKWDIAMERLERYTTWFWSTQLAKHFEIEEMYLFSVLGDEHELIKQAKAEHSSIKDIFESKIKDKETLLQLGLILEAHIRFEERILFNEIQQAASAEQLEDIQEYHHDLFNSEWEDEFWVKPS